MTQPKGYTLTQITLHWTVFLLVALQYILHDSIADAWRNIRRGLPYEFSLGIALHVVGGLLILALVIWRMAIKARRGAPALPEDEPAMLKLAANLTHLSLYGLLILMALSGAVAWFGNSDLAAQTHEVIRLLLLALIAFHFAGALYQQMVLKSDVMKRMGRPE